jgi:hypothetical protein
MDVAPAVADVVMEDVAEAVDDGEMPTTDNILLNCASGILYAFSKPQIGSSDESSTVELDKIKLEVLLPQVARRRRWLVAKWPLLQGSDVQQTFDLLSEHVMQRDNIKAMLCHVPDIGFIALINKSDWGDLRLDLSSCKAEYFGFTTKGKKRHDDVVLYGLALNKASVNTLSSIGYCDQSEIDVIEMLKDDWQQKDMESILTEIMQAQAINAELRSPRDAVIVKCHSTLLKYRKFKESKSSTQSGMKKFADLSKHIAYDIVEEKMKQTRAWTIDIQNGSDVSFSLHDFLVSGLMVKYSIILMGPPGLGKTPVAQLMAALIARGLQEKANLDESFYVQSGTIEGLAKIVSCLGENVPILFDDVTPSVKRGSRPALPADALKHIFNVQSAETIDARYSDIAIPHCPRLITSNAMTPHEWFAEIPHNLEKMSPATRLQSCSGDGLAILKRCAFVPISQSFVPAAKRAAYWNNVQDSAVAKMAKVMP